MKKSIQKALEDAAKRLEKQLPNIEKRKKEADKEDTEEPDHLRSGVGLDELEIKRILKEQENDDPKK